MLNASSNQINSSPSRELSLLPGFSQSPKLAGTSPVEQQFKRREYFPAKNLLWQIVQGYVRTLTMDTDGNFISLGFWGPGDLIGHPLSTSQPYYIECLTEATAIALLETDDCPFHDWLFQGLRSHNEQLESLLKISHAQAIEKRLMAFLVFLFQKFGYSTPSGWQLDLYLTHQDIAESISSSRVTVTRLMNQFQHDRIIDWSRHQRVFRIELSLVI